METNALATLKKTAVAKSIQDLVKAQKSSGLQDVVLVLDCSGSMHAGVDDHSEGVATRIEGLKKAVTEIQSLTPTAMVCLGPYVGFCTEVPEPDGGTPLAQALRMTADSGNVRCIVISDGQPTDGYLECYEEAKKFTRIDTIFCGGGAHGREFLAKLAEMTGGTSFVGDFGRVKELVGKVVLMLAEKN